MSVKVEIFSGFLGAGKTQLIKKLIEEGYYKEKIAIIENEFGEGNKRWMYLLSSYRRF